MQITSEKRYKLIPVTDLDIVYVGGMHDQITFGKADRIKHTDLAIEVMINDENGGALIEHIVCLKRNMASYRFRARNLRVEDKSPLPTLEGAVEAGDTADGQS